MKDTNPGSGVPVAIVRLNGVIRSIVYREWVHKYFEIISRSV